MRDSTRGGVAVWATVLIGLLLPGCATWPESDLAFDSVGGRNQRVAIRYCIDAQERSLPVAVARIEGQLVSYEPRTTTSVANDSLGVLEITYPHPRGHAGYSLARVTIGEDVDGGRTAGGKSGWIGLVGAGKDSTNVAGHESWEMDISKAEMDQLIARLRESQFFGPAEYSRSGVELTTNLDGKKTTKTWNQIPEFDALVQRVRHDGLLVSYRRNEVQAGVAVDDDDEPERGLARVLGPLLGATAVGKVPSDYVNETPQQLRAGSRFVSGGVRTSLTRISKKQLTDNRLRRLPVVHSVFMR